MVYLPPDRYSAVGSLFAAVGSLLAVIWFSASLFYQSRQLREQRQQFLEEFKQLREDARRSALALSKDILREAEGRALKYNPALESINDLMTVYMDWSELKIILESKDALEVQEAVKSWLKKEGPAMSLMHGIKSAAETYFRAVGQTEIDYYREPEDFVFIYGPILWKLPYFDTYQAVGTWLSEFMVMIQPGRKAVVLAATVSLLKTAPTKIMKRDKILENVERHRKADLPLPAIAEDL